MNPDAIRAYIEAAATKTQRFGSYDCVRFAVELVWVGFDRNYLGQLGYWDRKSAVRRLRRDGGLFQAFDAVLGPARSDLEPGDFVYYDDPPTIGVMLPSCVVVYSGGGFYNAPHDTARIGWRS